MSSFLFLPFALLGLLALFVMMFVTFMSNHIGYAALWGAVIGMGFVSYYATIISPPHESGFGIEIKVAYNLNECPREQPVQIGMVNIGANAILVKSFGVEAREAGVSEPLLSTTEDAYQIHRSLRSMETLVECWELSPNASSEQWRRIITLGPENLNWSAKGVRWESAVK